MAGSATVRLLLEPPGFRGLYESMIESVLSAAAADLMTLFHALLAIAGIAVLVLLGIFIYRLLTLLRGVEEVFGKAKGPVLDLVDQANPSSRKLMSSWTTRPR